MSAPPACLTLVWLGLVWFGLAWLGPNRLVEWTPPRVWHRVLRDRAIADYRQQLGAHDAVRANDVAIERLTEMVTRRTKETGARIMKHTAAVQATRDAIDAERREIVRGVVCACVGAHLCSHERDAEVCTCVHAHLGVLGRMLPC